ncbi:MAG: hypothetical protein DESF_01488 [Desulfovibrio sp.]
MSIRITFQIACCGRRFCLCAAIRQVWQVRGIGCPVPLSIQISPKAVAQTIMDRIAMIIFSVACSVSLILMVMRGIKQKSVIIQTEGAESRRVGVRIMYDDLNRRLHEGVRNFV